MTIEELKEYIGTYPDFPKEGILFRDICPLVANPEAFEKACYVIGSDIIDAYEKTSVIVAPDARGFIFGAPIARELGLPFIPVRKPGKLPGEIIQEEYNLEYGKGVLAMQKGSIKRGDKVAIIDDLIATGGTISAIIKLIEKMGGEVVHIVSLIELTDLNPRDELKGYSFSSIIQY